MKYFYAVKGQEVYERYRNIPNQISSVMYHEETSLEKKKKPLRDDMSINIIIAIHKSKSGRS